MRAAPSLAAPAVSELLRGETFALLDASGGWGWGFSEHDHYVGYVSRHALGPEAQITHVVTAPAALVFTDADIKSPLVDRLPMGVRITGVEIDGYVKLPDGFVHRRHVARIGDRDDDPAGIAERLIGVPYLWGGRSADGIDCSGLIQLAFGQCGVALPRDSDQQRLTGTVIAEDQPRRRGDLVFLPGHVGIMSDDRLLIHANAYWMATTREPLVDVLARQPPGAAVAHRRIEW